MCHVDGHVTDYENALGVRIAEEGLPLAGELILDPLPEAALGLELGLVRSRLVNILVLVSPGCPYSVVVVGLQSHEERVVGTPVNILLKIILVGCALVAALLKESCIRTAKHCVSCVKEPAVVNTKGVVLVLLKLLLGEQTCLCKNVKIYKVGVACNRRRGLIGAVTVGCGVEGQNLPALGFCLGNEVDKIVRALTEGADAVLRGKRAYRHQNSALVTEAKVLFYVNHKYVCPFRPYAYGRFSRFTIFYSITQKGHCQHLIYKKYIMHCAN